jgi:hypothetical protein
MRAAQAIAGKYGRPGALYTELPKGRETSHEMVDVLAQLGFSGCMVVPHPYSFEKWHVHLPVN